MLHTTALRRARLAGEGVLRQASPMPSGKALRDLEITGLRSHPLREPVSRRAYAVLRLEARSGLAGYGECPEISASVLAEARPAILGQSAAAHAIMGERLAGWPGLRAAVNMAMLDLVGRFSGAPVFQILGGPTRFKARALAPLEGESDSELEASLRRAAQAGFRTFLVPVPRPTARNQGQAFVQAAGRRLDTLAAAGGENANFVLDGAGKLTPGDAASLCKALEKFHLNWFDEPSAGASFGTLAKLAAETVTPIGFGRHLHDPAAFLDLLREAVVDVIRPPVGISGISQIRRMAALAETYYVAAAPYHDGGPVATAAALHLAASLPNFFIQQIPFPSAPEDVRMRAELTGGSVEAVREGFAGLPRGPGLGISVDEKALERYREGTA